MNIIILIIDLVILYDIVISMFSWHVDTEEEIKISGKCTFSILIACHNEEEVIEDNLLYIYNNTYDKKLYSVYVIADNCSDSTVERCMNFIKSHKDLNLSVIEVSGGSKPMALNLGIEHMKKSGLWVDDNIVVLDADNKMCKDLLTAYSYYHTNYKILQCRIVSDNSESFIAKSFTSSFNITSHSRQIARNRIGLSASLSGTGFSVDRNVFDEVDFQHCNTLTEDLEFSILAILKGYSIKFVNEQHVLNQNLDELKPSIIQRVRWCRGHAQVSSKLTWKIIKKFFQYPSFQMIDSFLFINTPARTVIFTLIMVLFMLCWGNVSQWILILNALMMLYNLMYGIMCNDWRIRSVLYNIHFTFCMYFSIVYGLITYKKTEWAKTKHKKTS